MVLLSTTCISVYALPSTSFISRPFTEWGRDECVHSTQLQSIECVVYCTVKIKVQDDDAMESQIINTDYS